MRLERSNLHQSLRLAGKALYLIEVADVSGMRFPRRPEHYTGYPYQRSLAFTQVSDWHTHFIT